MKNLLLAIFAIMVFAVSPPVVADVNNEPDAPFVVADCESKIDVASLVERQSEASQIKKVPDGQIQANQLTHPETIKGIVLVKQVRKASYIDNHLISESPPNIQKAFSYIK